MKPVPNELSACQVIYRTAFRTGFDAVAIFRMPDGIYIDVNESFLKTMGYSCDEVLGRTSAELNLWFDPRDREKLIKTLIENSAVRNLETKLRRKNGEVFWSLISASLFEINCVAYALSFFHNTTEAKQAEETINALELYDPLTDLPNRRFLLERLRDSQGVDPRNRKNQALILLDLDDFKMLNDAFGPETGDAWLKEVGNRLTECAGENCTVARLSGDEFAVLSDYLSADSEVAAVQAKKIADRILARIGEVFLMEGHDLQSSARVGITVFKELLEGSSAALQRAEIALAKARESDRNTVRFFSSDLQDAVIARAVLEEDLRLAIRDSQFSLYYQPQVEGGKLIGTEALIRWNHSKRGLVMPGDFIELAERSGLIIPLGKWILEEACRQIAEWSGNQEFSRITVAVNISAHQFRQPDFVDQVLTTIERTGADPRRLDLELTETMMVDDIDNVIEKMNVLRAAGVLLSLDDFGTGYSSLTYLKRMPLDKLKIDQSFVRDILEEEHSKSIARIIIALGSSIGFSVIAEGVESHEQEILLTSLGCHLFQGYLYSQPLPLVEFELLNEWKFYFIHTASSFRA
jgi:diguanylate cyclase (GGDEF)-like protein/PAS domain S-box-containing protein